MPPSCRPRVTKGAAAGHVGWSRRAGAHPLVTAAMAAAEVSVSWARIICDWTDRLPEDSRQEAHLLDAARSGLDLRDVTALAVEMYEKSRPQHPEDDPGRALEDRSVRLETTFGGAGVLSGDLTPECAADHRGAGRPVRSGGRRRHPQPRPELSRRSSRGHVLPGRQRDATGPGRGSPPRSGRVSPSLTDGAGRGFGVAGGVDRPGPGPVGGRPCGRLDRRRRRRRLAGGEGC